MEKTKLKFRTSDVILVCIATAMYLGAEWLQQTMVARGVVSSDSYNYFKFRVLAITIAATIEGPIDGILVAISGTVLANYIFYGYISGAEIVAYVINAIVLGYYSDKLKVLQGGFRGIRIIDFNVIQIVTNVFCSLMFSPLFLFVTEDMQLDLAIRTGAKSALGNVIGIGVYGTVILLMVSIYIKSKHPELNVQTEPIHRVVTSNKPVEFDERVRTMYKERL